MTASSSLADGVRTPGTETQPERDLASTGALHRVMGRVDAYLKCMTDPRATDRLRDQARLHVQAALAHELRNARVLSR